MVIENIIQIGNANLRKKSKKVTNIFSKETKEIIENLTETMRNLDCVGFAAPQIGNNLRIMVTEIKQTPYRNPEITDKLRIYINPKILWKSKKQKIIFEGCASVVNSQIFAPIKRPEKIIIQAFDENGKNFRLKTGGLLARVIQHEYNHLEGKLFTDKISNWKSVMSKEEYFNRLKKNQ